MLSFAIVVASIMIRAERSLLTTAGPDQSEPPVARGHVMATSDSTVTYKDIPGFPGYRVGDDGSVWSCRRKGSSGLLGSTWHRMKARQTQCGRLKINLCNGSGLVFTKLVHRLVLESFVGPCPPGCEACHFPDRDVTNNTLVNLRWDTPLGNARDREVHGTNPIGVKNHNSKLTPDSVRLIRQEYATGERTIKDIARQFGVSDNTAGLVIARRAWKHVD